MNKCVRIYVLPEKWNLNTQVLPNMSHLAPKEAWPILLHQALLGITLRINQESCNSFQEDSINHQDQYNRACIPKGPAGKRTGAADAPVPH